MHKKVQAYETVIIETRTILCFYENKNKNKDEVQSGNFNMAYFSSLIKICRIHITLGLKIVYKISPRRILFLRYLFKHKGCLRTLHRSKKVTEELIFKDTYDYFTKNGGIYAKKSTKQTNVSG